MNFDTKKYYLDTQIPSEIAETVYKNLDNFSWSLGALSDQFQVTKTDDAGNWIGVDQNLIQHDLLLKQIHDKARGQLNLFRFPPNTMYKWHTDKNNLFNINLIFEELPLTFSLFKLKTSDFDPDTVHRSLDAVVPVKYTPYCWLIYNTQIEHSVLNLSDKTRYLLTYTIKKENTKLTYDNAVSLITSIKKYYEKISQKNINP